MLVITAIVVVIILIASLRGLAHFWTDYLWFQSVHFTSVFRGVLLTKVFLALVFIAVFFVLMLANLVIADRLTASELDSADANELVVRYSELAISRDAGDNTPETLHVRLVGRVRFARIGTRWLAPGR